MDTGTVLKRYLLVWCLAVSSCLTKSEKYSYEKVPVYWHDLAQEELDISLQERPVGVAKNVIFFLGDGMGISTVTAARILAGQKAGKNGEEFKLSFDKFPYTGLSRTYNTDAQVTDSAASATAFLTGVKTNQGLLGLSGSVTRGWCNTTKGAEVSSILKWSQLAGKSTGIVTTTRITHATPAAAYSHSGERDWESDRLIPESEKDCEDIALQLVTRNKDINVIMGGGRVAFYPEDFEDPDPSPDFNTSKISRTDGRNLIEEWKTDKQTRSLKHKFVYNKSGLDVVDVTQTDFLFGLFAQNHLSYEIDRNATKEPSISDMVEKAIRILSKNDKGFFLLVEGGRIDHGHHDTKASKALNEVIAMSQAVEIAKKLTSQSETLIVVTADHSHVMNIAGYPVRGNPILGTVQPVEAGDDRTLDAMPYTTIIYGNGPGYNSTRQNLTFVNTQSKRYVFQSGVPMEKETHGGEDVAIYATGPHSFLFSGVHEENYMAVAMAYASCVGPYAEAKKACASQTRKERAIVECNQHKNSGEHIFLTSGAAILAYSLFLLCTF